MTEQTIGGANKIGKVPVLLKACLKVFPFRLPLLCHNHFGWVPLAIRLCICACHPDVHYSVGTVSPEATHKNVCYVVFACGLVAGATDWTST